MLDNAVSLSSRRPATERRDIADCAIEYAARGWRVHPLRDAGKEPRLDGWPNAASTDPEIIRVWWREWPRANVGVVMGTASGGLVDADLDCPESVALASTFMPETGSTFGHGVTPESHWLYVCDQVPVYLKLSDPITKETLLELRTDKHQTMFPGSIHPNGEPVEWAKDGSPARVSGLELSVACKKLAAACLLTRYWPKEGSRQDTALALAGGLLRAGWTEENTKTFMHAVAAAAGDEESQKRVATVQDTQKKLKADLPVTGWPKLAELVGEKVVQDVRRWLGLRQGLSQQPPQGSLMKKKTEDISEPPQSYCENSVHLQDLPAVTPDNPYDPVWSGLNPFVYWVYQKLKQHATAARAKGTPTYEGRNVFYAQQSTLAGQEVSINTVKRALMILKNKNLIAPVPLHWLWKHLEYVRGNGHFKHQKKGPTYWVLI